MHDYGLTDITIILDRSGSMGTIKNATIEAFNKFLREQKEVPGKANVTLVQFDDQYQVDYEGWDIKNACFLTQNSYVPRGMTALLDAIGRTITSTEKRVLKTNPAKIVFVIQTDGYENASKEFSQSRINEMISHLRNAHNWEFVFLGASQDAIQVATSYGILSSNAVYYMHSDEGINDVFNTVCCNLTSYRNGTSSNMEFKGDNE
jgi:hypothetical protein